MKAKKPAKPVVHDLRDLLPVKGAVPDVSGEFPGLLPPSESDGPDIVSPAIGHEPAGQTTND
jgi:hypothetical protein